MRKTGAEMAEELISWLNGSNETDISDFVSEVSRSHRTLQQMFFGLIMAMLQLWSDRFRVGCFDGRNEFTCKKSYEIVSEIELMDCKRAPLI